MICQTPMVNLLRTTEKNRPISSSKETSEKVFYSHENEIQRQHFFKHNELKDFSQRIIKSMLENFVSSS
jgi:hypothetical protein